MKRTLTVILIGFCLFVVPIDAKPKKKAKKNDGKVTIKCPTTLNSIKDCPDTGCGLLDPLLNKQKNTTAGNPDDAKDITFTVFAKLPKRVKGYNKIGAPRKPLVKKGEGSLVRVSGWALDSRPQNTRDPNKHGESCNCGFTGVDDPQNTDVHIVLVGDSTLKLKAPAGNGKTAAQNTLKKREARSLTAEFTPRLRVARHERFDGAKLKGLISSANDGALKVRVTGLLMYDSEHALGPFKLLRKTDWEIHPVFRLEYCPKDKNCTLKNDANWKNLESP